MFFLSVAKKNQAKLPDASREFLLLFLLKLLNIDSLFNLLPAPDGWLAKRLSRAKLLHGSSLLEFTLKAL